MFLKFLGTGIWIGSIFCTLSNLIALILLVATLLSGSSWLQIHLDMHWNAVLVIHAVTISTAILAILVSALSPRHLEDKN